MRTILILASAAALLVCTTAYAHHSYGATYDVSKQVKVDGKIVGFVFRNPHSFVHIEATDDKGVSQRWSFEWGGTSQLGNQGLSKDSLSIGDVVSVVGRPSRVRGEYRALLVTLKRPSDGFTWGSKAGEVVD